MASPFQPTPLGFALLCEIRAKPRGGYALRRLCETTPLGVFSSSPGSIYPALTRLQREGLVDAIGSGRGGRYEITASGDRLVDAWLSRPVTLEEVSTRLDLCLLRFAFLKSHPDPSLHVPFLTSLIAAAEERESQLADFLAGLEGEGLPTLGRLTVDHGVRSIRTTKEWARDAIATLVAFANGDEK